MTKRFRANLCAKATAPLFPAMKPDQNLADGTNVICLAMYLAGQFGTVLIA